jgi:epoxyqueuosine reductase QueG
MYGEKVNVQLRDDLVTALKQQGIEAVAPTRTSYFSRELSDKYGFASTWSERHAAYASGLGTFGLSDGLITPRGKAMRTGSVIARIRIDPTPRPYTDHHAYCLFYSHGICGKCIKRCPVDAIGESGHDKITCRQYVHETMADYIKSRYNFEGKGCGLCQTAVPCESKIPVPADADAD